MINLNPEKAPNMRIKILVLVECKFHRMRAICTYFMIMHYVSAFFIYVLVLTGPSLGLQVSR